MSTVPIIAAAADLPFALRRAERYVESRGYVAQRARELGLGELVPESWNIPTTKTEAVMASITAAGWDPSLHPRGRDGRFIDFHGLLNLFDGTGFDKPSMRAEAIGVRKENGKDILTVRAKSVGSFGGKARAVGDEFDVPSGMAEAAPDTKAKLTHPVFKGEVKPQGEVIKGEATDLKKAQDRADAAAKELADAEASGDKARITKARTSNTAAKKNLEKQQALEDKAGEDLTSQLEQSVAQLDKPDAPDAPADPLEGEDIDLVDEADSIMEDGLDEYSPGEIQDLVSQLEAAGHADKAKELDQAYADAGGYDGGDDEEFVDGNTLDDGLGFEGGDYEPTTEWEPGDDPIDDPAEYARHILMEGAAYEDVLNEDGDSDPQMVGYIRDLQAALDGDVGDPNVQRELETRANDLRGHLVDEEYSDDAELPTFRGPDSSPSFPDEPASIDDIPSGMTPTQQAADQWENDNHDYLEGLSEDARADLESAIADEDWQGALDVMDANYEYGHGNAIDEFREKVVNKEAYDVSQRDAADTAYSDLIDALGENPELSTDEIGRELMDRGHTPDAVDAAIARHEAENGPDAGGQPGLPDGITEKASDPTGTGGFAEGYFTVQTANGPEYIRYSETPYGKKHGSLSRADAEAEARSKLDTEAVVAKQFAKENPTPTTDLFDANGDEELQGAFDKWAGEMRDAGFSDEDIANRVEYAQGWTPSWKAATPEEARAKGEANAQYGMGRDRLVAFPVGDPGKAGFGGYEVWHTNPDGSQNGGRGSYPDKETAQAFIEASNAEYDRKLQEKIDAVPARVKEWASGKDPFTVQQAKLNLEAATVEMDPQNPEDMDQLKVMQARIAAMDDILAKAPAPKADDVIDAGPDIVAGDKVGEVKAPAPTSASPQRAAIELSLGNSASNKGFEPGDLDAVFSAATPEDAHKAMAAEMTRLKLGGKQRKRLRELLDLHFGSDSGDSAAVQAKATADALPDDNELKSRLAAKAAAPKVDAPEAGSVVKTYADVKAGDSIRIGKDWVTVKDTRVDPKSERHILTLVDADGDEFERDTDGLLSVNVREGSVPKLTDGEPGMPTTLSSDLADDISNASDGQLLLWQKALAKGTMGGWTPAQVGDLATEMHKRGLKGVGDGKGGSSKTKLQKAGDEFAAMKSGKPGLEAIGGTYDANSAQAAVNEIDAIRGPGAAFLPKDVDNDLADAIRYLNYTAGGESNGAFDLASDRKVAIASLQEAYNKLPAGPNADRVYELLSKLRGTGEPGKA